MKLSLKIAKVLVRLINGESVPNSTVKSKILEDLIAENILFRKGKHHKHLELINDKGLQLYLANQLQINNLYDYISALENEDSTRAEFVKISIPFQCLLFISEIIKVAVLICSNSFVSSDKYF